MHITFLLPLAIHNRSLLLKPQLSFPFLNLFRHGLHSWPDVWLQVDIDTYNVYIYIYRSVTHMFMHIKYAIYVTYKCNLKIIDL